MIARAVGALAGGVAGEATVMERTEGAEEASGMERVVLTICIFCGDARVE